MSLSPLSPRPQLTELPAAAVKHTTAPCLFSYRNFRKRTNKPHRYPASCWPSFSLSPHSHRQREMGIHKYFIFTTKSFTPPPPFFFLNGGCLNPPAQEKSIAFRWPPLEKIADALSSVQFTQPYCLLAVI